ncbi:TPA: hypothetical protein ACOTFX_001210 [Clostridium perfringens]|uniref:hypothetical protein n=1 Tax=Clostridium perfringens TaxID=1502 RepID=UPI001009C98E|nr:hypothetical protein [Clostridium perfringens]RXI80751.1 hypothetical protein C6V94_07225 [Clostridium perfringens]RXI82827.1 hypothetical protein C6V92_11135 [Clostridium perfringens]RXI83638.1 hypothetical protein C6V96_07530 [Clostridium perfringens]RXI87990.1 hypothetical protein C6V95_06670 [Clostridium perfringens]RXI90611.1 hypothetical protein C6V93_07580 [Clostridium perfringens]
MINLEKKYFDYICGIVEPHLGEILNKIGSYNNIIYSSNQGLKSNIFESKLENVVESLITRQLLWNILATNILSDSCY